MKKILNIILLSTISYVTYAQSGTNSPYSQYGLGLMSDQSSGFNRGMNGLGLGFHEHNQVNFLNPASYSEIDSLSFIFDAGISGQLTNFKENGVRKNAKNADFEYAVAAFRLAKHFGMSFGILPYTNIGYNYSNTDYIGGIKTTTYTNTFNGSGGLHQVYLGAGWQPFRGFSFGANFSYLWGDYSRSIVNSYSDSYINTLSKYYTCDISSYNVNFGLQYTLPLSKKDKFTIGLTYGLGHKLGADPECQVINTNSQTSVADTATYKINNGLKIPETIGAGFAWYHNNKWKLGADYTWQKWSKIDFPEYNVVNNTPQYILKSDMFKDRHKVTLGGEYCYNILGRNFLSRIRYRFGVSYATPYLKINNNDGPKELSISGGFGIPIINNYNNRSVLNISCQWVHNSAKSLITENIFRINIGITFNEMWFMKWKVE